MEELYLCFSDDVLYPVLDVVCSLQELVSSNCKLSSDLLSFVARHQVICLLIVLCFDRHSLSKSTLVNNSLFFFAMLCKNSHWLFMSFVKHSYQWWANVKLNLSSESEIFRQKGLNIYAKSQIKSHPGIANHFRPNLKSNHNSGQHWNLDILEVPHERDGKWAHTNLVWNVC